MTFNHSFALALHTPTTMYKFLVLAAALAVANAGYAPAVAYAAPAYAAPAYAAPAYAHAPAYAAVGSSQQSTIRSLDGNSVVSQYSKAVDTAYSSVRKYDTRVSNDGVAIAPAVAYHAPAAYAAPAYAPAAYAAPAYHAPAAYAAPAYHAPAAYAAPAYHAPAAYAAPVVAKAPALLGVAYSAAPAVAHLSFDGYGVHYGY